jgi:hypothetical protein
MGTWIPQLFYDLIGRILPGGFLILLTAWIFKFKPLIVISEKVSQDSSNTTPYSLDILSLFLLSYMVGAMLGGIGFMVSIIKKEIWNKTKISTTSWATTFSALFWGSNYISGGATPVSTAYDMIQCFMPRAAGRLAKLRAESHLCRVLIVGSAFLFFMTLIKNTLVDNPAISRLILSMVFLSSICFLMHIKSRTIDFLENNWLICKKILASHGNLCEVK